MFLEYFGFRGSKTGHNGESINGARYNDKRDDDKDYNDRDSPTSEFL